MKAAPFEMGLERWLGYVAEGEGINGMFSCSLAKEVNVSVHSTLQVTLEASKQENQ